MATATLSSKSQLVLPAEIRRKLGIHPGDRLVVELEGDHAVIRKAPPLRRRGAGRLPFRGLAGLRR